MSKLRLIFGVILLVMGSARVGFAQTSAPAPYTPTCLASAMIASVQAEAGIISAATGIDGASLTNFLLKQADFVCMLAAQQNAISAIQTTQLTDEGNISGISTALGALTLRVAALEAAATGNPPPAIAVSVSCVPASIPSSGTSTCTPTVTGTSTQNVTWSSVGGFIGVGSGPAITFTPAAGATSGVVTATAVADPSKSGSATVAIVTTPTTGLLGWLGFDGLTGTLAIGQSVTVNSNAGPVRDNPDGLQLCGLANQPACPAVGTPGTIVAGPQTAGIVWWKVQF